ncbi:MAG: pirin-like C-terminal cupin domain-containing protein [Candidatus Nitrosopolaris sp.]|jgi:hypothetical protein
MKTSRAGQIRICRICGTTPTLTNRNYDLCHKCYALYLEAREKAYKQFLVDKDGDKVTIRNPESADSSDVLLIGGMPLNQPIAHYGPFVMNTHEEIDQAEPKSRMFSCAAVAPTLFESN